MIERLKRWWIGLTLNEKLMYVLVTALAIGIATRWRYVFTEVGDAFRHIFTR